MKRGLVSVKKKELCVCTTPSAGLVSDFADPQTKCCGPKTLKQSPQVPSTINGIVLTFCEMLSLPRVR